MIQEQTHSILCTAPAAAVYGLICRTEDWPSILTPCEAVRTIGVDGDSRTVEISARVNGQLMAWRSRRQLRPEVFGIEADIDDGMPLVEWMHTSWRVVELSDEECVLLVEHRYQMAEDVSGRVEGVSTPQDAQRFMTTAIDGNSKRELADFKAAAERPPSGDAARDGHSRHSVVCAADPEVVYQVVRDTSTWPQLFDACVGTEVTERDGPTEIVRIDAVQGGQRVGWSTRRRYHDALRRIDYDLVDPMPFVERMSGQWRVVALGAEASLLTVDRWWRILPDVAGIREGVESVAQAADLVSGFIDANASAEMVAIQALVEQGPGPVRDPGPARVPLPALRRRAGGSPSPAGAPGGGALMPPRIPAAVFAACGYFLPRLMFLNCRYAPQLHWGDVATALDGFGVDDLDLSSSGFWGEWGERWDRLAQDYLEAAAASCTRAGRARARRSAAACYHWAEFMDFDDAARKARRRQAVRDCFVASLEGTQLDLTVETVAVGDGSDALLWLAMPPGGDLPRPCAVFCNGLDSMTEVEILSLAEPFLERGIAAAMFEGPGQGLGLGRAPLRLDMETVVQSVVRRVQADCRVDDQRLAFVGISFGGYFALRVAQHLGDAFRCVVNLSGGPRVAPFDRLPRRLKDDFRFAFMAESGLSMPDLLERATLDLSKPVVTEVLSVHGALDDIFPIDDLEQLDKAWEHHELVVYEGEAHVCLNRINFVTQHIADWVACRLGTATW